MPLPTPLALIPLSTLILSFSRSYVPLCPGRLMPLTLLLRCSPTPSCSATTEHPSRTFLPLSDLPSSLISCPTFPQCCVSSIWALISFKNVFATCPTIKCNFIHYFMHISLISSGEINFSSFRMTITSFCTSYRIQFF